MSTWHDSRKITTRLVITGDLVLTTPAHLGNGEQGEGVDLVLQRDPLDGRPLLPGSSIAGALRAYLQAYEYGYRTPEQTEQPDSLAQRLFGGTKRDPKGNQSPLIVDDAFAAQSGVEIRDGVGIDSTRRTARDKVKYDLELLPAGTIFHLRFELLLSEGSTGMEQALALALHGLEQGEIIIGARRSRGFGRCRATGWRLNRYNLRDSGGLLDWLRADLEPPTETPLSPITSLLGQPTSNDRRDAVSLHATFELASPLLIRAEQPLRAEDGTLLQGNTQPDAIHLVNAAGQPVLPGTSLAGALRARAGRILCTFHNDDHVQKCLCSLFGWTSESGLDQQPAASRLLVTETIIEQARTLVQSQVGIDRFTGGAYDTALFHTAPCVAGRVQTTITIIKPEKRDVGLLLLLLKDLWSGDLPLGGAASIGHGRLRGVEATLRWQDRQWGISVDSDQRMRVTGDQDALEGFVAAIAKEEPCRV